MSCHTDTMSMKNTILTVETFIQPITPDGLKIRQNLNQFMYAIHNHAIEIN